MMRRHPAVVTAHYSALVLLAIVCVAPIVLMFATSLKVQTQIFTNSISFFFVPTLENYREVLGEGSFMRYLTNSLIVGVVSTVITLVLGCMAAYGLARFRFKGRKTIAYTTLLLRTVPLAVLAVPVFMLWSQAGLINSLPGLVLLYVAVNLPLRSGCSMALCCRCRPSWKKRRPSTAAAPSRCSTRSCCRSSSRGWRRRPSSPSASRGMNSSWPWC
jgi:ABC-type glycerol-3-phosphate transport system permease component